MVFKKCPAAWLDFLNDRQSRLTLFIAVPGEAKKEN